MVTGKKAIGSKETKEIQLIIDEKFRAGVGKQAIIDELWTKFFDKDALAQLVAFTPDPERKAQYQVLNRVLVALLSCAVVIPALGVAAAVISINIFSGLLWLPLLLMLGTSIGAVAKFKGNGYRLAGLASFTVLLVNCMVLPNTLLAWWIFGFFSVLLVITGTLGYYLGKKLFPQYGLVVCRIKDSQGNYIL